MSTAAARMTDQGELDAAVRIARRALASHRATTEAQLTCLLDNEWFAPSSPLARAESSRPSLPGSDVSEAGHGRRHVPSAATGTSSVTGQRGATSQHGAPGPRGETVLRGAGTDPETSTLARQFAGGQRCHTTGGWSRTWGPAWSPHLEHSGPDVLVLFLAAEQQHLAELLATLTARTESWDEPWALRTTTEHRLAGRPDATVLHLPVEAFGRLAGEVRALLTDVGPLLAGAAPALTLRLAPGAGIGQNAVGGLLFGEHRCHVIARCVLTHPEATYDELVRRARTALGRTGLDPVHPYRVRGSAWDLRWR
ncbi:MAG: hypothetical protein JJE50_06910 [Actinomycetales bacterium]|nr:hypothetical protein [Actinomycetales bacterium]